MAGQIGSLSFDTMNGPMQGPRQQATRRDRPGVDGTEIRKIGQREPVSRLTTLKTALDANAAATIQDSYENAVTEIANIETASGVAWPDCFIADVRVSIQPIITPTTDPSHTRLVRATWTIFQKYVT